MWGMTKKLKQNTIISNTITNNKLIKSNTFLYREHADDRKQDVYLAAKLVCLLPNVQGTMICM